MPLTRTRVAVALVVAATVLALPAAAAVPEPTAPAAERPPPAGAPVPGQVLVRTTDPGLVPAVVAAAGARGARALPWRADVHLLEVPLGSEAAAVERLADVPGVRWATRNRVLRAAVAPNDPGFVAQWHLQRRSVSPFSANWEPVNGTVATGAGTVVAVLDTGVTADAELATLPGYDFVDLDADPSDPNGHGTHVAGTVAQTTGNGVGVAGVAPRAGLLPVRVLDDAGAGTAAQLLSGIAFAVGQGADVINLSLGGGPADESLCEAVTSADAAGSVVVAAAGNEAAPVSFPAACPGAVAVSAVDLRGALASYSNRGPEITLAAPGGDVTADADEDGYPDGVLQFSVFEATPSLYFLSGTSMAAPHVAGAAALVRQLRPDLPPRQVADVLTSTALDIGQPGADSSFGAGLLDIGAVVASLGVTLTAEGSGTSAAPPATGVAPTTDTQTTFSDGTLRLAGPDRYATAVAISRAGWSGGSDLVFLASGERFPDALAATPSADRFSAPLLLTGSCLLPQSIADELARLSPRTLVVLGGPDAVCRSVVDAAVARTGATPLRVAGADRFGTAAALTRPLPAGGAEVYLASGTAFPDALSGGARAAQADAPLLLTLPCTLPRATADALARLRPARVTVLGGPPAVCDDVVRAAAAAAGGDGPAAATRRLAGGDRFATAAAVARDGWDAPGVVGIANGLTFPDALAGGAYLAQIQGPLLLVQRDAVPAATRAALLELQPQRLTIFGGPAAVADSARVELELYASAP